MSTTMQRGICWALAALQVTPDTMAGNDPKTPMSVALKPSHDTKTNHLHTLHEKNAGAPSTTTTASTTSSLLVGVVDAVLSIGSGGDGDRDGVENVQPRYTRDEVADHCSGDSCWIIVNNRVYDVTSFLRMHPGGEDIILEYGGHDATSGFIDKGHSLDAFEMLNDYCIGEVVKGEWYPEKNHT